MPNISFIQIYSSYTRLKNDSLSHGPIRKILCILVEVVEYRFANKYNFFKTPIRKTILKKIY